MSAAVIIPTGGELRERPDGDAKAGVSEPLYDIEIPVRLGFSSPVSPAIYPRGLPATRVIIEDVDLGVPGWRELAGKDVAFDEGYETDGAIYLGGVHNQIHLRRLSFGKAGRKRIPCVVELELDFSCVNPRPPELAKSLSVRWEIDFKIVEGEE